MPFVSYSMPPDTFHPFSFTPSPYTQRRFSLCGQFFPPPSHGSFTRAVLTEIFTAALTAFSCVCKNSRTFYHFLSLLCMGVPALQAVGLFGVPLMLHSSLAASRSELLPLQSLTLLYKRF